MNGPWPATRQKGILPARRSLTSRSSALSDKQLEGNLYHYSEHVDTMRLGDPTYVRDVRNLLRSKYEGRPLDLIFVFGDVAVDFVSKQRASFFPEIPIVFSTADPVPVMPNSTGITTPIRQRRVLETALRVQPDTRHVAIVAGSSAYDQYYVQVGARGVQTVRRSSHVHLPDRTADARAAESRLNAAGAFDHSLHGRDGGRGGSPVSAAGNAGEREHGSECADLRLARPGTGSRTRWRDDEHS